jgi:prepilin-type processing-associated H-X9-DG protein
MISIAVPTVWASRHAAAEGSPSDIKPGADTVPAAVPVELDGLHLSERVIPVPKSISLAAQKALARKRPEPEAVPAATDKAGWKAYAARYNANIAAMLQPITQKLPAHATPATMGGVPVYIGAPNTLADRNADKVLVHLHGGGLVLLGGEAVGLQAVVEAFVMRCKVVAVDYRIPPDHPYPAALEDCVAVYQDLLKSYPAEKIVVSGISAGGNLAAALMLKLRDSGVKLPAAVGLFSPEVDLTESGDTFQTNRDLDIVLRHGQPEANALYADGHDLADPYISPLFGDFSKGFVPTYIQSGTRDLFLSNAVRIHRRLKAAGIDAELNVWEAMPHGSFGGAPEDRETHAEFAKFLTRKAGWTSP